MLQLRPDVVTFNVCELKELKIMHVIRIIILETVLLFKSFSSDDDEGISSILKTKQKHITHGK